MRWTVQSNRCVRLLALLWVLVAASLLNSCVDLVDNLKYACEEDGDCGAGFVCAQVQSAPAGKECIHTTEEVTDTPYHGVYVTIPAGRFTMGAPEGELGKDSDETQHEVVLTRPFLLKATEVTQGEWVALMDSYYNPSQFRAGPYTYDAGITYDVCGYDCPVEKVNWYDALAYCNALSRFEGLSECYDLSECSGRPGLHKFDDDSIGYDCPDDLTFSLDCEGYRLPTEAEWEYSARAGKATTFSSGDITEGEETCADDPNLDGAAWYCDNSEEKTHPVGSKPANAWGLYDMHGNVWEMVWDWHADYPTSEVTDPVGPGTGSHRVKRGGGWTSVARFARSANRGTSQAPDRHSTRGFRPARSVQP